MADDASIENGGTSGWRPWLIVLLALVEVPRAVDEVVVAHIAPMTTRLPWHGWFELFSGAGEIIAFLTAGLLVDRFAVTRVACFSLLAWAALSTMSAAFAGNVFALFVEHDLQLVAGIGFGLAVVIAVKLWFPLARRARVLAVLNVVATVCLLGVPPALHAVRWPPITFEKTTWAAGGVAIATGAAILAALLWRILRASEIGASPTYVVRSIGAMIGDTMILMRRPGVLALVLVLASHMLALSVLLRVLYPYIELERRLPQADFLPSVGPPFVAYVVAQLALAYWSDTRVRETRMPSFARAPFIVVGASLAGAIGLIPLIPDLGLAPVYWLVAMGMAAFPLCFTLALDIVPAALAGRFLGVAMAIALAIAILVFMLAAALVRPTRSLAWYFYFAGVASIIGAIIAHRNLRHIDPIEDGHTSARRIGEVFA